jgi:hypothetical protein
MDLVVVDSNEEAASLFSGSAVAQTDVPVFFLFICWAEMTLIEQGTACEKRVCLMR